MWHSLLCQTALVMSISSMYVVCPYDVIVNLCNFTMTILFHYAPILLIGRLACENILLYSFVYVQHEHSKDFLRER